jgi:hypothetical protein
MNFNLPSQFTVRSKPILPVDLSLRLKEMQPLASYSHYHPAFHGPPSPGSHSLIPGGPLQSQNQMPGMPTWQDMGNSTSGYHPVSSMTPRPPSSVYHPGPPNSASSGRSELACDGILRQGPRKRTAHACEKCRDRKTKVCTFPFRFVD